MSVSRLITTVSLFAVQSAWTQTADSPRFEVASIRPSSPSNNALRPPVRKDAERVVYNSLSPKILVQLAYGAPEWGVVGGPKWFDSDTYDFEAKLPPNSSDDQIALMMRAFLAERFQLTVQHETRQQSVYMLVVAKSGAKMKPGETGEQWNGGRMRGGIFRGRIVLHQLTMTGLAETLALQVGRPVIDKTNLHGIFDVNLKWTPTEVSRDGPDADGPSLSTAITEQLGLKLESGRAPVEVLVISHIEKPSVN